MTIEVLILHYIQEKRQKPSHANELLDYIQHEYVSGKLSIFQYRSLCQDLYFRGAKQTNSV
ncbi:YppF family protein [Peribacillus butanolivorans]|uniref:YppF family protein n=1 Tax=Peribacillus butanolivorans TaxID=421767 RepID=UPI0009F82E99|nr:YppF family protein [Peribacillus butanolivorans]